ncbi:OmpA family protein [Paracoccus sanguinis]|uniref:OmpA family protein n=1 Tax=Paracoccus sanguinis TaxID=1545044 RepID=UPI0014528FDD|nr:OmpA family protein [Paracoccus sanguinis]QJD17628.1 OmpA family protein [Paracoccus sanguinis]
MRRIFRDTTAIALGLGLTLPALASAQTLSAADAARVGAERAANMPELARMLDEEIGDGLTADKLVCLMNAPKPCPEAAPQFTPEGIAVQLVEDGSFILAPAPQQTMRVKDGVLVPVEGGKMYGKPLAAAPAAEPVVTAAAAPAEAPVVVPAEPAAEAPAAEAPAAEPAAEPDAVAEAARAAAKDAADAAKDAAKDAKEAAKHEAKAAKDEAKDVAKAAKDEAKAVKDAAKDAAAEARDAAKAEGAPSDDELAKALAERAASAEAAATPSAPVTTAETATAAPVVTPAAPPATPAETESAAPAPATPSAAPVVTPAPQAAATPATPPSAGAAPVVTPAVPEAQAAATPAAPAPSAAEQDALAEALAAAKAIPEATAKETDAAREAAAAAEAPAVAALAESAAPVVTTDKTTVTEATSRAATEDFSTDLRGAARDAVAAAAAAAAAGGQPVVTPAPEGATTTPSPAQTASGDSDLESALKNIVLPALAGMAVGSVLSNNREVALNTGDRVVVTRADGSQEVIKDDNALMLRPGSTVQTEEFADGSSRTIVTREDGSQVVTIRDADLRVLRRTVVHPDGTTTALIDETQAVQPVDIASLPRPAEPIIVMPGQTVSDEALREALRRETTVDRSFTLGQIRNIPEVRALVAPVDIQAITFDTGSAAIKPDQAQALSSLGRVIAEQIRQNPGEMFLIEGHTDTVGADAMNLALSDRRAESVALALTEFFRVPPENMVVQGYGEQFLKVAREGDVRANRRAAVRRITDLLARN